ncbi:MAG: transcriptional repressor [Chloroflexota bacterium]|nr:transcriptional repressor [Chloroflexota bacterium]
MAQAQQLVDAVDQAGYRLTEPRRAVAALVASRSGHFTAEELIRDARTRRLGVGRATVFRALDLFNELGLVERVDLPSGDHAYISCEPAHHHHVICSRCGRTTEVGDCGMRTVAEEVARRTGYAIDSHRVELYGLCPHCRAGNGATPRE